MLRNILQKLKRTQIANRINRPIKNRLYIHCTKVKEKKKLGKTWYQFSNTYKAFMSIKSFCFRKIFRIYYIIRMPKVLHTIKNKFYYIYEKLFLYFLNIELYCFFFFLQILVNAHINVVEITLMIEKANGFSLCKPWLGNLRVDYSNRYIIKVSDTIFSPFKLSFFQISSSTGNIPSQQLFLDIWKAKLFLFNDHQISSAIHSTYSL